MATSLTPLANRYFIFNCFEKPTDVEQFEKKWREAGEYVRTQQHFIATYLHKSSDATTRFPWVNMAVAQSSDICFFGKPDPKWAELTRSSMVSIAKACPGSFREVASYGGNELVENDKSSPESSRFFITTVKVTDSITDEKFEANWKEASGANLLHNKLEDVKVKDSLLYRRFETKMPPVFRYVVRTEVEDVADDCGHAIAKALNDRAAVEGVETTTGFYDVAIVYQHA